MRRAAALLAAGVTALLLLVTGAPAQAHTELVASTPADGASLARPLRQVALTFDDVLLAEGATVLVRGPGGTDLARGPAVVDGRTVTVQVTPAVRAGRHQVVYRVVAADGHPVVGTIGFRLTAGALRDATVGPAPASAPEPRTGTAVGRGGVAAPDAPGPAGAGSSWTVAGIGLLTLAALLVIGGRRARLTTGEEDVDGHVGG